MTPLARPALPFLALLVAVSAAGCGGAPKTAAAPPPPPVVVGQAVRKTIPVALQAIGNVESTASVAVRSRVAGQILSVHIKDGADLTAGQTLFTIDPEPFRIALDRAEAQLARDKALLQKADNDLARYAKLVDKEYVTREQYESASSEAASQAATIQFDEALVKNARLDLSYCTIVSPIAGRAGSINLRAGNLVKVNDDPPLVTILKVRPVYVTFSVPEKFLADVRRHAAEGTLEVRAAARGEDSSGHAGVLAFIDNEVAASTGTIRLQGQFPNDDLGLWPGQFVEVTLKLADQHDAVIVPSPAVQVGQQGSFVFVVSGDGTAEARPVVVDRLMGADTVIASGLDGGETIVVDGQIRVVPGGKVSVQTAP
jgi:membrane fusion protein, multidrug efflux system